MANPQIYPMASDASGSYELVSLDLFPFLSLFLPVNLPRQRPQQPLMDCRFPLDYFRQVKQLLLNIRRQVQ